MSEFKLEISVSRGGVSESLLTYFLDLTKKSRILRRDFSGGFRLTKGQKTKQNRLRRQQNFNTLRPICTFYTYFFFLKVVKVPKVKICFTAELES